MKNILLLASTSKSRQRLLHESKIPFEIVKQDADESNFDWTLPLKDIVEQIAVHKMNHVILPKGQKEGQFCFVLTADTLGRDSKGNICRKPTSKQDAIDMIKSYRTGSQTGSAFCLDKKIWKNNKWETHTRVLEFVNSTYIFDIPDNWIERYFELSKAAGIDYMQVSGAVAIEEFGAQFLKTMNGSYTAVVGLPMYELRQALEKLDFFD